MYKWEIVIRDEVSTEKKTFTGEFDSKEQFNEELKKMIN